MFLLAILIACGGGGEQAGATSSDPAAVPEPAKRLNVAKAPASTGPRKTPLEVLLTGDPRLFGTYVDAGEVWIDVGLGSMIIDESGKVVTKPDITQNIRSVGLRGVDEFHVVEEKADPNSEGNKLKKVRAIGKYQGCEASPTEAGATVCYIDVGDPPPGYRDDIEKQPTFSPGFTTVPKGHGPTPPSAPTEPPSK